MGANQEERAKPSQVKQSQPMERADHTRAHVRAHTHGPIRRNLGRCSKSVLESRGGSSKHASIPLQASTRLSCIAGGARISTVTALCAACSCDRQVVAEVEVYDWDEV